MVPVFGDLELTSKSQWWQNDEKKSSAYHPFILSTFVTSVDILKNFAHTETAAFIELVHFLPQLNFYFDVF